MIDLSKLDEGLYEAIQTSYDSSNYANAIIDAMKYLSDKIHDISGLDLDGYPLASKAFSPNEPLIKLNKMQTQTEKDIQHGTMNLFQGLYLAIRNPRVHNLIKDDQHTADTLIHFINYMLLQIRIINPYYSFLSIIWKLQDKMFVESWDYAKEIVKQIPKGRRFDTLIELTRRVNDLKFTNIAFLSRQLYVDLPSDKQELFITVISQDLEDCEDVNLLKLILSILSDQDWQKVQKVAKIRSENWIIKSLQSGVTNSRGDLMDEDGELAIHAASKFPSFEDQYQLMVMLVEKLTRSYVDKAYIFKGFLPHIHKIDYCIIFEEVVIESLISSMKDEEDNEGYLTNQLKEAFTNLPERWRKKIIAQNPEAESWYIPI